MAVEEFQRWYARAGKIAVDRSQRINTQDNGVFRRNDDLVRIVSRAYGLPMARGQKAEIGTSNENIYMSFVEGEFEVEVYVSPKVAEMRFRQHRAKSYVARRFSRSA